MPWLSQEQPVLPHQDAVSFAFDDCDYDKDKPIYFDVHDPSRSISWNQAHDMVRKLVCGFRKAGLKKGDCFSITSFNEIMFSMLFLGGVGAGGIFSGMNPAYGPFEIRHHIKTADVNFFLVEPELLDGLLKVMDEDGISHDKLFIFNTKPDQKVPAGFRSWTWLLEQGSEDWERITDPNVLRGLELSRLTTSGTTGPPKFAQQTHWNGTSYHTLVTGKREVPWEPRTLSVLPSFHVSTVPAVHVSPLRSGHPIHVMRRFDLEGYLSAAQKYQITELGMAPPLVIAIIMSPLSKKYSLKSVRRIGCGAAPLDAESQNRLQALCADDCVFTQVWGMTETTSVLSMFQWPDSDETGSVDITAYDTRGEVCVRGNTIIKGYYKNQKATEESWDSEGFFHTGDILYCDGKSKKWYCVDRKKELIKVRGFQVAPPELEGLLLAHPDIADAAVIGVPEAGEEKPRAFVVRQPGSKVTEDEVKHVISSQLASYKRLTGGVTFVDEIPKSPNGKILKRILRDRVAAEKKAQSKL